MSTKLQGAQAWAATGQQAARRRIVDTAFPPRIMMVVETKSFHADEIAGSLRDLNARGVMGLRGRDGLERASSVVGDGSVRRFASGDSRPRLVGRRACRFGVVSGFGRIGKAEATGWQRPNLEWSFTKGTRSERDPDLPGEQPFMI